MSTVESMSVEEILGKIEHKIAFHLDQIASKLQGEIHNNTKYGGRMQDRVQSMFERMGRVQTGIDKVLLVQKHII